MSRARVSAAATSAGPKLHLQNSIRSPFSRHSWNKRLSQRVGTQTPCYAKGSGREDDAAWEARKGALDAVMKDIEKQYGKGIVTVLGEEAAKAKWWTSSESLDAVESQLMDSLSLGAPVRGRPNDQNACLTIDTQRSLLIGFFFKIQKSIFDQFSQPILTILRQ